MSVEDGERMSVEQKFVIKEIDKSTSRLNYKSAKGELHHSLTNE
jgi:hypothetical protein